MVGNRIYLASAESCILLKMLLGAGEGIAPASGADPQPEE